MRVYDMHMILPWSSVICIHVSEARLALAIKLDHEAVRHKLLVCGLTIYRMKIRFEAKNCVEKKQIIEGHSFKKHLPGAVRVRPGAGTTNEFI